MRAAITMDHGLAAAGMAAAISSMAFAAFMVYQSGPTTPIGPYQDDMPLIHSADAKLPFSERALGMFGGQTVDFSSTGSISLPKSRRGARRTGEKNKGLSSTPKVATHQERAPYTLRFVYKNTALVNSAKGLYIARRGTLLPGAGRVLSIGRHGTKWILVTDETVIVESN